MRLRDRRLPVAEIVVALVVLLVGAGIYAAAHRDEDELAGARERGTAIVAALENYAGAHDRYPPALADLRPEYLDSIPAPGWGGDWQYRPLRDGRYCELYVRNGRLTLRYDFAAGRWALDN